MLRTEQLSCQIADSCILRELSVSIEAGEFISIVGPNGSGKTTLLRCLLGLIPFTGNVYLEQKSILDYSRREIAKNIAYLPQLVGTLPAFSVEQFVQMGRYAHRSHIFNPCKHDKAVVDAALELTKTAEFRNRPVTSLSGGERQRVFLASAIVQETDAIILDEPSSFLDPQHEVELYQILQQLHSEQRKTICLVSHDINRSAFVSSRVIALKNGAVCFNGSPDAFMNSDVLEHVYGTPFFLVDHPELGSRVAFSGGLNNE